MSSVIEVISSGDIIYEVTLDQPSPIYEVTISDTSPTCEVISFDPGMLSLALIDDSTATAFRAYSSFKVSQLLTGYSTTSHNHDLVYQPLGTYLTPSAIGISVQAYDADLTSWAGIAPSSKQDTLTFDLIPTDESTNPVQSNGVFDALAGKSDISHSHTLDALTDVTAPTPTIGDTLSWNGSAWVNSVPSAGGSSTLTIDNKVAAYTVVAGDLGKIINCTSGTFTISLTAATTLGAGFYCTIWNNSVTAADTITIDPSGAETIDGSGTIILRRGEGLELVCNGTNWYTGSQKELSWIASNADYTNTKPVASGDGAIAWGISATASGLSSIAGGIGASSSGEKSIAFFGNASGQNAISIGNSNFVSHTFGVALGTMCYTKSSKISLKANGYFNVAKSGDAQAGKFILMGLTIDAATTTLTANLGAPSTTNILILPNTSTYAFNGTVVARDSYTGDSAKWNIDALMKRGANASTTALVGTPTITKVFNDAGAATWTLALTADTTNGGGVLAGTGAVGDLIYWVTNIDSAEVIC